MKTLVRTLMLAVLVLWLPEPTDAANLTAVTDTVRVPLLASTFNGRVTICNPEMLWDSTTYVQGCQTITITAGALSVTLVPNDEALPAGTNYSVTYYPTNGSLSWTETWYVTASATALKLTDVKVRSVSTPNVPRLPLVQLGNVAAAGKIIISDGTKWAAGDVPAPAASGVRSFFAATAPLVYASATGTFSCPTCGTVSAWGSITGILSAQTDLQAALDGKSSTSHLHTGVYEPVDLNILRATGIYSNPAWLTALAWSKITGAPATYAPSAHASAHMALGADPLSLTLAEIAAGAKTGSGARAATASGVPADGCASWATGNIGSTGLPCGSGGGTVTSIASASQAFTAQTSVTITHNFNSLSQVVACYDGSAQWIQPNSVTAGLSTTTVTFTSAQTGSCIDLGGTGLYSQAFTAQTSVSLTHSLGTQAIIVSCYDGGNARVEPSTVVATSTSAATVTFSAAQSGSCVVAASLALSGGGGAGTVTSVGLTAPAEFSVSGSPITGAGALGLTWASQTAGKVLAAPAGSTGTPSFRVLAQSDLPVMTGDTGTGGAKGAAPAPAAGDATAGKYLKADGTWAVPPGGGSTYTAGDGIQIVANVISADTTVPAVAVSGTQSLTFGTIAQSSCVTQNITATGATVGDRVVPGYPATLPDGLMGMMFVSATDTVQVRLCKITAASADVTGLTFTYQIIRAR